jgi:hypothetical protein
VVKPILLTFLLVAALPMSASEQLPKAAAPDEAAQEAASKLIADVYKSDYDNAKTAKQKIELARKLLAEGVATKDDSVNRFVLLRLAKDIGAQYGDITIAFEAVEQIQREFDIDALKLKADAASTAVKAAKLSKDSQVCLELLAPHIDQAISEDRYDLAAMFSKLALTCARETKDSDLIRQHVLISKKIEKASVAFETVRDAKSTLETEPTDPASNFAFGKFVCLYKDDWPRGLAMLALGNDEEVKSAAEMELQTEPDLVILGDRWWQIAEKMQGAEKASAREHACGFFQKALPSLTGLTKARVERLVALVPASKSSVSGQPKPKLPTGSTSGQRNAKPQTDDKWRMLISDIGTYKAHWKNGDNRGNYFYDAESNSININSPWQLGVISSDQSWTEFYFDVTVQSISFGSFDMKVNGVSFRLDDAFKQLPGRFPVRVVFNPDKNLAIIYVGTDIASQSTITDARWNANLRCEFSSNGGQIAKVQLTNVKLSPVSTNDDQTNRSSETAMPAVNASSRPTTDSKHKSGNASKSSTKGSFSTPDKSWTMLISDVLTYKSRWKSGDNRGSYFYDANANAINMDSYLQLGSVSVEQSWTEFYFEVSGPGLSLGRLDIRINGVTFKLGDAVKNSSGKVPIRIVYLPEQSQATAYVGDEVASQATIANEKWNAVFRCDFSSDSAQNIKLQLLNLQLRPSAVKK